MHQLLTTFVGIKSRSGNLDSNSPDSKQHLQFEWSARGLPPSITEAPSLNAFKERLDNYWATIFPDLT